MTNERSYLPITLEDLTRLGRLAASDRQGLFRRRPETGTLYRHRLFAVALCQGAALHFLDGTTGIKDFDIWGFYTAAPQRPFPYRRRGVVDFGIPKFGVSLDSIQFVGRRVDMMGRSLPNSDPEDPVESLRGYLIKRRTKSAACLAQKAVILIEPQELIGTVVWPAAQNPVPLKALNTI